MIEPKVRSGARALLFDRLVDTEPESQKEVRPLRALDKNGLKASIRRELGRLLNTRCPMPLTPTDERTVINYGIPDFSWLSLYNGDHRARLASWIRDAIVAYAESNSWERRVRTLAEEFVAITMHDAEADVRPQGSPLMRS